MAGPCRASAAAPVLVGRTYDSRDRPALGNLQECRCRQSASPGSHAAAFAYSRWCRGCCGRSASFAPRPAEAGGDAFTHAIAGAVEHILPLDSPYRGRTGHDVGCCHYSNGEDVGGGGQQVLLLASGRAWHRELSLLRRCGTRKQTILRRSRPDCLPAATSLKDERTRKKQPTVMVRRGIRYPEGSPEFEKMMTE